MHEHTEQPREDLLAEGDEGGGEGHVCNAKTIAYLKIKFIKIYISYKKDEEQVAYAAIVESFIG